MREPKTETYPIEGMERPVFANARDGIIVAPVGTTRGIFDGMMRADLTDWYGTERVSGGFRGVEVKVF